MADPEATFAATAGIDRASSDRVRLEEATRDDDAFALAPDATLGYRAAKRAVDIVVSAILLILLSPLLLIVAVAIRLTTPGPALFRQTRVGYLGEPFVVWKFRTMDHDNDDSIHRSFVAELFTGHPAADPADGGAYKLTADPRITRIGAFLRRSSIDELPQLVNVLRGSMSLVGPRPALAWELDLYGPEHFARFASKPGITGLWQVSGRSDLTMPEALALDAEYVRTRSTRKDLGILVRTVPVVLGRRGAW